MFCKTRNKTLNFEEIQHRTKNSHENKQGLAQNDFDTKSAPGPQRDKTAVVGAWAKKDKGKKGIQKSSSRKALKNGLEKGFKKAVHKKA